MHKNNVHLRRRWLWNRHFHPIIPPLLLLLLLLLLLGLLKNITLANPLPWPWTRLCPLARDLLRHRSATTRIPTDQLLDSSEGTQRRSGIAAAGS
jgi:hypothetical protein